MRTKKNSLLLSVFFYLLLKTSFALAISDEMLNVVRLETKANAVATRSDKMVIVEHYEIPKSVVEADIADRIPKAYLESLVFQKNGQEYVRWIVNPEDTKWHLEVEGFLAKKGLDSKRYKYFQGYQTASRSYIVVDPNSKAEFSIKVSTNNTGGHWVDKKQTWDDAKQIRMVTDFVMTQLKGQHKLEHSILLDEPLALGIAELDQGLILRSYEGLAKSGRSYIPGFSVVHEKFGQAIAQANGATNPGSYWNDHYNKPLAKALAEFLVVSGMTYDSPHSQNFMVELDPAGKPTGRVVLRDFGDTYVLKQFFAAQGRIDIANKWEEKNVRDLRLPVSVGILHGNEPPSWISMEFKDKEIVKKENYHRWGYDFHQAFRREIFRQTGLKFPVEKVQANGRYVSSSLGFGNETGTEFLFRAKTNKQRSLGGACEKVFLAN